MSIKSFPFNLAVISSLVSSVALAAPQQLITNPNPLDTAAYWTPERMRDATPMDLPMANQQQLVKISKKELKEKFANLHPQRVDGAPPSVHVTPQYQQLFQPRLKKTRTTFDAGSLKEQFSSSQLTPLTADTSYPYTTVGRLFFTTPSGNKTCSGAVIGNRVVVTAGHCLHNGNGMSTGWYGNWMFVPAYHNGSAPFSTWSYNAGTLSYSWYAGGGTVPNAEDWAFLVFKDQTINGSVKTLGSVVGKLGYLTLNTIPNHAHLLGYPDNLDNGQLMHQVTAQSALAVSPNNAEYGSDMNLGAGGGPWVQNFGAASAGQTGGTNPGRNLIIGITSYGYNDTTSLGNGSSILNADFASLYSFICGTGSGNC